MTYRKTLVALVLLAAAGCGPDPSGLSGESNPVAPAYPDAPTQLVDPPIPATTQRPFPQELVGTWQGGADDAFWYTFAADGTFRFENRRQRVATTGRAVVEGSRITMYRPNSVVLFGPRTWRVESMSAYGEPIHVLYLDGDTYAKDE